MRTIAAASVLLSGCFYLDRINQRPSIDIHQRSSAEVHRGDYVQLDAVYSDPEGGAGQFLWGAFACTQVSDTDGTSCDEAPFYTGAAQAAYFAVPPRRRDESPVQSVRVVLDARDDRGASALPSQTLVIPVGNAPPQLAVRKVERRNGYVIGASIDLFAQYGDVDDGAAHVELSWQVFSPNTQPPFTLVDVPVSDDEDPERVTVGKRLVAGGGGAWTVRVTAADPLVSSSSMIELEVHADRAPCLAQLQPAVPPPGVALPVGAPTLFQVTADDDLDVYPPDLRDPGLGVASFAWSLQRGGETGHARLTGAIGSSFVLDPRVYTPGEIVELRVEALDRSHAAAPCADELATCPVATVANCTQRQTWRVEIR